MFDKPTVQWQQNCLHRIFLLHFIAVISTSKNRNFKCPIACESFFMLSDLPPISFCSIYSFSCRLMLRILMWTSWMRESETKLHFFVLIDFLRIYWHARGRNRSFSRFPLDEFQMSSFIVAPLLCLSGHVLRITDFLQSDCRWIKKNSWQKHITSVCCNFHILISLLQSSIPKRHLDQSVRSLVS